MPGSGWHYFNGTIGSDNISITLDYHRFSPQVYSQV
jgi:hypothetical protein